MKRLIPILLIAMTAGYVVAGKKSLILIAQTLPYQSIVSWDASPDGVSYNCYLDGTIVTSVTTLTCNVPIPTLGTHNISVTAVNLTFIPSESIPFTVAFTLKQPTKPNNIRIK